MKPAAAAKEKTSQPSPSRPRDRASRMRAPRPARSSGPTSSYLQTRIRASRLLNAVRILAFIELSRRLHQAYRQAYDKQAADWLLPQNPGLDPSVSGLVSNALASSDCIEFARTVLNGVSNKKNPVFPAGGSLIDVFNAFLAQGANHPLITRNKPSDSWGYGNPVGNIEKGDAAVFSPNGSTTGSDADTVIAELFHLAGQNEYYSDEQLANAVRHSKYASDASKVIAPEANIFDKQQYQARGWKKHQAYSAYFHYIQMLHCTAVPQPPGHPRRIK